MRPVERIDDILKEIGKVWKLYPDFRLGQLISNVVRDPALYYCEDNDLVAAIKRHYDYVDFLDDNFESEGE